MSKGKAVIRGAVTASLWKWQAFRGIWRAMTRPVAAIILAAGKGTRMKSDLHKVLHPIAGRPMLAHLLASVGALAPAHTVVVVGDRREQVEPLVARLRRRRSRCRTRSIGTGHAVQQAESALAGFDGDVLILFGDVPFVRRRDDAAHARPAGGG